MDRYTITYHHTTKDGFKVYLLQDTTKKEFNDGRIIIFSYLEWCEKLKRDLINNDNQPAKIEYNQLNLFNEVI